MKTVVYLAFLVLLLLPGAGFGQPDYAYLFPVRVNGYWGFIDTTGKVVIPPKFLNAGDFSEGFAPVRIGGRYGYINTKGKLQIKAKYEYAESFLDGLGKVWLSGKPFFVDKKGKLTYDDRFLEIDGFRDGEQRAIVTLRYYRSGFNPQGKKGLIDRDGNLILDTLFSSILRISENRYLCTYFYQDSTIRIAFEKGDYTSYRDYSAVCILDGNGKVIVPTGIFYIARSSYPGFARVNLIRDSTNTERYIDSDGNILEKPNLNYPQLIGSKNDLDERLKNHITRSCDNHGYISYFNRIGRSIWRESAPVFFIFPPQKLNTDHLLYYLFYTINKITDSNSTFPKDSISLVIQPNNTGSLKYRLEPPYRTFKGYFVNNTKDSITYSKPYFGLEAKDKDGIWRDLIYRPRITCGTGSDGIQHLAPLEYFEFDIPDFEGEFETELRLAVGINKMYYSKPVKTRINPSQFWREPIESKTSVVLPYPDYKR
ncbi:MAG: WG repeat-containing protein [Saprospiraceae bacterium]